MARAALAFRHILRHGSLAAVLLGASMAVHAESHWVAFSSATGQPPLPLILDGLDGKPVDLASFKGQVVLLNFWATWCDGCREEIPALNRLQQSYKESRLRVVGVNVGEGKARIAEFTEHIPMHYTILRDVDSAVLKAWHIRIMPNTFLIDRNGMLRYQLIGEADWNDPKIQAPLLELLK